MKRFFFVVLGALALTSLTARGADQPRGTVLELHSCELYAGGCTISAEATQGGRYMLRVWEFAGGELDGIQVDGLSVALLQSSHDNLATRDSKSGDAVIYLPESSTAEQQQALLSWVKSRPDFLPETLHVRREPLALKRNGSDWSFTAGKLIAVNTRPLQSCDARSCGEELWYEPRTATEAFTVAVNQRSTVVEPLLKITWNDANQRSVFLGRFEGSSVRRDVFLSMADFCGASGMF